MDKPEKEQICKTTNWEREIMSRNNLKKDTFVTDHSEKKTILERDLINYNSERGKSEEGQF